MYDLDLIPTLSTPARTSDSILPFPEGPLLPLHLAGLRVREVRPPLQVGLLARLPRQGRSLRALRRLGGGG